MSIFSHRNPLAGLSPRRALVAGLLIALAVLGAFAVAGQAAGCTSTWNNASGGSWNTAADWTGGVPNSTSAVACLPALASSYTVTLTTGVTVDSLDVGASSGMTTQTLDIEGTNGADGSLTLTADSTIESTGHLILDSTSGASSGYAQIVGGSGVTLTNNGSIVSQVESTSNLDFLETNLMNASGATVEVKSGELRQDHATTTTNDGTWTVDAGASPGYTLTSGTASFVNDAGTVTNDGAIKLSSGASWSQSGGSESGNPVTLTGGTLTDSGTTGSTGSFDVQNTVAVSGTIAAGETVTATGITGTDATINAGSGLVNDGKIVLDSQAGTSSGFAELEGGPVTNNGTLDSQVESSNLDYLEAGLTNSASGTVEVKSGELRQDHATATTNDGTWIVDAGASPGYTLTSGSASFVNDSGSVTNSGAITLSSGASWSQDGGSESGNPVKLTGGSLTDNGTGSSGSFDVENTVVVSGTIAAGETVTAAGVMGTNANINAASGLVNDGTLVLDSQAGSSSGYAELTGGPVTNNGTLDSQVESTNLDYLEAGLTNSATGTLEVKSGALRQDTGTTTTNDGTFKTDSGMSPGAFNLTSGTAKFVNAAGSVANDGSITLSSGASWSQSGGSESGNPVTLTGGTLTDSGTTGSTGSFDVQNTVAVSGTIAAGETVTATGITGTDANINASSGLVNDGTLVLDSQAGASSGFAELEGGPVTNNGTLDSQVESSNLDYLEAGLTNSASGTVEVKSGELRQDHATATTNDGTWIVDAGVSPGYTITSSTASFVNDAGSVTNGGAITLSSGASWSQEGGSESGNPVKLTGGSLTDNGTGSSGSFDVENTVVVSGTIAAGETVTAAGVMGTNANINAASGLVNDGTLVLDSQAGSSSGYAELTGGPVTNNGTIDTQVESTNNLDYLEASLTNSATGTLEVKSGALRQDQATTTTNDGDVIVDVPGQFNLTSSNAVFDEASTGTLTFDISGASTFGTINFSSGATFTFNGGTADPVLQNGYAPAVGTEFDVITFTTAHGAGTFTTIENDFTGDYANALFIGLVRDRDHTTTSVMSSPNPSTQGQQVTFTATVTPGPNGVSNPTGTVTFFDNGTMIGTGTLSTTAGVTTATFPTSSLTVGTHPITASYGGDSNYKPSPVSSPALNQVVNIGDTSTTTLASSANPSTFGQSVTFTATVSGASGPPTGTVTFFDNGSSIGSGMLSTTAGVTTATLQTSSLAVGTHPITAQYSGDGTYAGSMGTLAPNQVVNKAATSTALVSSLNPSTLGQSVTFTTTVTGVAGTDPTGSVTFEDNGTSIGTGTVSTTAGLTTATLTTSSLAAGTHPITAVYGGDGNYQASHSSPTVSQVVNQIATSTSLASSANPATAGQTVTYTATVSPVPDGGTMAFSGLSGCGAVSVSTTTGTATCPVANSGAGSLTIHATYSGDASYAGSTSPPLTEVVNAARPQTNTLTVTRAGKGAGSVTSSPAGISCPSACAHDFTAGSTVTLTEKATSESAFGGWSGGGCSGTATTCAVTLSSAQTVTATFTTLITGQRLFCGRQHRGKCNGVKDKTLFTGPGNASWQFGLYNPSPGNSGKSLVLGTVTDHVTKAGAVTITFSLSSGRIAHLIAKGSKHHLTELGCRTTFTSKTGQRTTTIQLLRVKLP